MKFLKKLQGDLAPYKKAIAASIVLIVGEAFNYWLAYFGYDLRVPEWAIGTATIVVVYFAENIHPTEVAVGKLLKSVDKYGIEDRQAVAQMLEQIKE